MNENNNNILTYYVIDIILYVNILMYHKMSKYSKKRSKYLVNYTINLYKIIKYIFQDNL